MVRRNRHETAEMHRVARFHKGVGLFGGFGPVGGVFELADHFIGVPEELDIRHHRLSAVHGGAHFVDVFQQTERRRIGVGPVAHEIHAAIPSEKGRIAQDRVVEGAGFRQIPLQPLRRQRAAVDIAGAVQPPPPDIVQLRRGGRQHALLRLLRQRPERHAHHAPGAVHMGGRLPETGLLRQLQTGGMEALIKFALLVFGFGVEEQISRGFRIPDRLAQRLDRFLQMAAVFRMVMADVAGELIAASGILHHHRVEFLLVPVAPGIHLEQRTHPVLQPRVGAAHGGGRRFEIAGLLHILRHEKERGR